MAKKSQIPRPAKPIGDPLLLLAMFKKKMTAFMN